MNLYYAYPVVVCIVSFSLFLVWKMTDWLNTVLKVVFFFLFLWSMLDSVDRLGYLDGYRDKRPIAEKEGGNK